MSSWQQDEAACYDALLYEAEQHENEQDMDPEAALSGLVLDLVGDEDDGR